MALRKNPKRLILAQRVTPVVHAADAVLLTSEEGSVALTGSIYVDLVRQLAQGVTWKQLERRLGKTHSRQDLLARLAGLVESGLVGTPEAGTRAEAAFWEGASHVVPSGSVAVHSLCGALTEPVVQAIEANGIAIRRKAPRALAITDDYLRPELAAFSSQSPEWLLAKPVGHTIWIGPLLARKSGACWWCLAHWLRTNRWQEAALYGWDERSFPPRPAVAALPATVTLAAGLVSTVVALWIAGGDFDELRSRIITFDTRTLHLTSHVVHRRPGCPHCGRRTSRPAATPPLREWVSPLTGIVSHVEVSETPPLGFFQGRAAQVQPLPRPRARSLLQPSWAFGRGRSAADAETACLAEAMEHYSTVYQGTERGVRATMADVDGINPASILLFSERQYRDRDDWNARHSVLHWIPERFDPRRAIRWTEATGVFTGVKKYLPIGCCYLRYPFKNELEWGSADSNGCAAGRTLQEAVLSGLSELIERDAVAIWWYNRVARPAVDLASFNEPFLSSVRGEWAAEGRDLHLLDVTNDLGMFVYVATAPRQDGSELYFASAAHPDSRTAAIKAIGELSQTIYWSTRVQAPPELGQWLATARLTDHEYFRPTGTVSAVDVQVARPVEEEVRACAARIHAAGIESYYVDLTRPEINVPVVRVVAPGLRHFWARLGPGRLYDVPCRMGWLDMPNREDDLNPIPCMA